MAQIQLDNDIQLFNTASYAKSYKEKRKIVIMEIKGRLRAILLLPIGVILFLTSWLIYSIGTYKTENKKEDCKNTKSTYELEFAVLPPEEQQIQT